MPNSYIVTLCCDSSSKAIVDTVRGIRTLTGLDLRTAKQIADWLFEATDRNEKELIVSASQLGSFYYWDRMCSANSNLYLSGIREYKELAVMDVRHYER